MAIRGDYFTEGKLNFNAGAYLQIVAGCQLPSNWQLFEA
jgi:hypothetical protein